MGVENFIAFIITAFIFVVTPGMDTLFVLNKSLGQGRRSGVYASLGINTGVLVHTLLGALGLSVLIAKSPMGFTIIKYVGALYILYLGVMSFRSKNNPLLMSENEGQGFKAKASFWSGFVTNALNPKVAMFFMAFFPQFINPAQLQSPIPFITLGLTYAVLGIMWLFVLAFFAGSFSQKIQSNAKIGTQINKVCGVVFIGMGLIMGMM